MKGEIGETVRRLSRFLPPDLRLGIFNLLIDSYDDKTLAKEIGCQPSSIHKWKGNGSSIPDEYTPKILVLALQRCPDTKDFLRREVSDEVIRLCTDLDILDNGKEENNFSIFMRSLDEKSREIVWYFLRNRHGGIRELAELINASVDMDVLTRVREVINPRAEDILGKSMLKFEESKIDPFTGDKILFSWWLADDLPLQETDGMLDVFDEEDHLLIITELPGVEEDDITVKVKDDILTISTADNGYHRRTPLFYAVEGDIEMAYKNGILEVRLEKIKMGESNVLEKEEGG